MPYKLKWEARKLLHKIGLFEFLDRRRATRNFRAGRSHESEFRVFAGLANSSLIFFDVGANAGQSALSARLFHPNLNVFSFEPNVLMKKDLEHAKAILRENFQYFLFGLGSENKHDKFYIPYVNGVPLFQEATFDRRVLESDRVTLDRIFDATGSRDFEIRESLFEIKRMDSLQIKPDIVKIDVQGTELEVIKGMGNLLTDARPLFMIENGPHLKSVTDHLAKAGYKLFSFDPGSEKLRPADSTAEDLNMFFVHPESIFGKMSNFLF